MSSIAPLPGGDGGAAGLSWFAVRRRRWPGLARRLGAVWWLCGVCGRPGRKPANRTAKEMTTRALGAGSEACSLAEGAGGDRRGGPAGRADRECGDAEQGDADVAEQGERLDSGDGAGVNALEHRRGLGVAESAGD